MVHLPSFTRRAALAGGSLAVAAAVFPMTTQSQTSRPLSPKDAAAKEEYAYSIAIQAYLFAHPLFMTERERKLRLTMTSPRPDEPAAPINQLGHLRKLATASGSLPYSPNNDTLYTGALLELKDQPMILHVPDIPDRFFVVEVADAYTTNLPYFAGTRASGGKGGDFALVGPDWKGTLPAGVTEIRGPTNTILIAIRNRVNDDADVPEVNRLQDLYSITALSDWSKGRGNTTPLVPKLLPRPEYTGDYSYFRTAADLMSENPPLPHDEAMVKSFEYIGLVPGKPFDASKLDAPTLKGILRAEKEGPAIVQWKILNRGVSSPTYWAVDLQGGSYGFDYLSRAEIAHSGLVANDPEEAVYFLMYFDGNGERLDGSKKYVVHFDAGQLPTFDELGFWSLTLYDGETYQFVKNPINRYSIGSRTSGLKFNQDGSLDIYIQSSMPAGHESNWLPSAEGRPVRLNIRCYLPTAEMLKMESAVKHLPPVKLQV